MKIDRLVSIIMLLLDKKRISAQELADKFEVSPRTIYRDIDTINLAGIPVLSTSGVGGGFEIMQNYKIDKNVFSSKDISAILMGLTGLSDIIIGDDLINAITKVKSFIPSDNVKDIEIKSNQIHIDLTPWIGYKNIKKYLDIIKTALQDNKLLSFYYADRYGHRTNRIAEPYQLVLKSRHWYWYGYCNERRDFRLFKLTRVSNLQMLNDHFIQREFQKPQLEFNDILSTLQKNITLRIHKTIMDNVLEYCSDENFKSDKEDYYLVKFPFIENDYYYNIIMSFGDRCECLEPLHIRSEIKRRVEKLADIYKN